MIERCTRPASGRVALIARSREAGLYVVWIGRPVEIGSMARNAGGGIGQAIGPARTKRGVMALRTL